MIIPQIAENLTRRGLLPLPEVCPVCKEKIKVKQEKDVKVLICENNECLAKKIKMFTHFMSRDAMNMEGLSEATVEKMISRGFITELADLFHLEKYKDEIIEMEGFGERSFTKMIDSINKARKVSLPKFIYSLGIANIGLSNAKLICKAYNHDIDKVLHAKKEELVQIDKIGEVIAQAYVSFMENESNQILVADLLKEMEIEENMENTKEQTMDNLNFVITGALTQFSNRKEAQEFIESKGGKVTGSVTSKTSFLINNDNMSNSSKNKKAKELGIPILTEMEFLEKFGE